MKQKKYVSGRYFYKTDLGRVRLTNEDKVIALTNARGNILLVVCDGMGGANKGDYASSLAVNYISDAFKNKEKFFSKFSAKMWAKNVIRGANADIYRHASSNKAFQGMGTTLTLVLIINDAMIVGQVGDSRAYSYRARSLTRLTEDQTYVQYLFNTHQITKEEMETHPKRHVLLNALGVYPSLDLDIQTYPYFNDTLLLCSDGLYNNVSESDIANIIKSNDTLEQKVNKMISLANANGGSDNIGIVLWEAQN